MAIIKKYTVRVDSVEEKTKGVYTVNLVSEGRKFKFKPGQFIHFSLDEYDPSLPWPESRCFSVQSSPAKEKLTFTYSAIGEYTGKMAKMLKPGYVCSVKMPYGDLFLQQHDKMNSIFIAGGTGITPFLSLFTDSDFEAYEKPKLFCGFKSKSFNFYEEDFISAGKINSTFTYSPYYENEQGFIKVSDVLEHSTKESSFFISGPPVMITFFKEELVKSGIAEEQIYTDDWE